MKRAIIVFGLFFFLVYILIKRSNDINIDLAIAEINAGYSGIVSEKYYHKITHITVRKENGVDTTMAIHNLRLADYIQPGDRITKLKEDNICLIDRVGTRTQFLYRSISDVERAHPKWPASWKGKWIDH